jgi:amino acid transporter
MANDGLLFQSLAKINPRTKMPVQATLLSGLLAGKSFHKVMVFLAYMLCILADTNIKKLNHILIKLFLFLLSTSRTFSLLSCMVFIFSCSKLLI